MRHVLLHSPLDMHLHLREGDILQMVTPLSAQAFAGAVIMPNLVPPVDNQSGLSTTASRSMPRVAGPSSSRI
jgi:dihydroorotase